MALKSTTDGFDSIYVALRQCDQAYIQFVRYKSRAKRSVSTDDQLLLITRRRQLGARTANEFIAPSSLSLALWAVRERPDNPIYPQGRLRAPCICIRALPPDRLPLPPSIRVSRRGAAADGRKEKFDGYKRVRETFAEKVQTGKIY